MADEEGREGRLAREYLTCTPILEVAVQQVLWKATHMAPEGRQRLAESRPELRPDVDQVVFNLLVEHFTSEELNHQVQWMTTRRGVHGSISNRHSGRESATPSSRSSNGPSGTSEGRKDAREQALGVQ